MVVSTNISSLTSTKEIAAGGEGKIYEHSSSKNKVVKVYHKPRDSKFLKHLEKMSKLYWTSSHATNTFVVPIDIYIGSNKEVLGFSMDFVNFNDYWLLNNLFNKGFCNTNNITYDFKVNILDSLRKAVEELHSKEVVIGDLNQYNIFFNAKGELLFVDIDSYQTKDSPHSGVLLDDIRDWSTQDINKSTDIWAYDILAFWSLTFCHPFKWVVPGNKESLEMRVKSSRSILLRIPGVKIPALYQPPNDELKAQFSEIFNGRRYFVQFMGSPTPVNAVVTQMISSQSLIIREIAKNVSTFYACNMRFSYKIMNGNWNLCSAYMKGIVNHLKISTREAICDDLYPSGTTYCLRNNNVLESEDGTYKKLFNNPLFQYNDGFLGVIEYDSDIQWNYNINDQIRGSINCSNTPIYARSITKRSSLIQNFGSKKYVNKPNRQSYMLVGVHMSCKDAFTVGNYIGEEYIDKNKVVYEIRDVTNKVMQIKDYLPNFAIISSDLILIPDDGLIHLYKDFQLLTNYDCPICTRNSKLYSTNAGILMLESGILYLLNTKT